MKCKICGSRISDDATKCSVCGATVSGNTDVVVDTENVNLNRTICPNCGKEVIGEHRYCPSCRWELALNKESADIKVEAVENKPKINSTNEKDVKANSSEKSESKIEELTYEIEDYYPWFLPVIGIISLPGSIAYVYNIITCGDFGYPIVIFGLLSIKGFGFSFFSILDKWLPKKVNVILDKFRISLLFIGILLIIGMLFMFLPIALEDNENTRNLQVALVKIAMACFFLVEWHS